MSDFQARKAERRKYYEMHIKGWKLRECTACSGTGYYDNDGSPKCWSCSGTGKERTRPVVGSPAVSSGDRKAET